MGVDAVKGPCAVSIFSVLCVLLVIVIVNRVGGGGGVGGGMLTFFATARFSCTSTHTSCYATASFSCTFTHTSCYATASFSCTFTQTSCYATARFLFLALFSCCLVALGGSCHGNLRFRWAGQKTKEPSVVAFLDSRMTQWF